MDGDHTDAAASAVGRGITAPGPAPPDEAEVGYSRGWLWIAGLFLLSGVSGLLYEIIWLRKLSLVFGCTSLAATTVLAAFMAGLGLGSLWFGRLVARRPRQALAMYVWQQLGIAAYALLSLWLLDALTPLYVWLHQAVGGRWWALSAARSICAFVALLPATVLMGGTLPALSRRFVQSTSALCPTVAALYGLNTLGAALGCAAATYVLIGLAGMWRTLVLGAVLNVAAAAGTWCAARGQAHVRAAADSSPLPRGLGPDGPWLPRLFLAFVALSGCCGLAYETLWARLLGRVIGTDVQAFGAMLTTFLLGIALGSCLIARAKRAQQDLLVTFISIELFTGLFGMLSLPLLAGVHQPILSATCRWMGKLGWAEPASHLTICVVAIIIPCTLMGMIFPVAAALYGQRFSRTGHGVGRVLGANTLGGVAGPLIATFALVPLCGTERGVVVVALGNVLIAAALTCLCASLYRGRAGRLRLVGFGLLLALAFSVSMRAAREPLLYMGQSPPPYDRVWSQEDVVGRLTVLESREDSSVRQLLLDRDDVAHSRYTDVRALKMAAHLALLLAPAPRRALLMGFGSGITSGSAACHPVEIDCVELQQLQTTSAGFFSRWNRSVLGQGRFRFMVGDARNHLLLSRDRYDVIIRDAFPPQQSQDLFSAEFYALCKSRLNKRGLVAGFVYADVCESESRFRELIGTFAQSFHDASLWYAAPGHLILIGHERPFEIHGPAWVQGMALPAVQADLSSVHVSDPSVLLSHFIAAGDALRQYSEGNRITTDDRPFGYSPRGRRDPQVTAQIHASLLKLRTPVTPLLVGRADAQPDSGPLRGLEKAFAATGFLIAAHRLALDMDSKAAEAMYERVLEAYPSHATGRRDAAMHLLAMSRNLFLNGDFEPAQHYARKAVTYDPELGVAHEWLGAIEEKAGRIAAALTEYRRALRLNPHLKVAANRVKHFSRLAD